MYIQRKFMAAIRPVDNALREQIKEDLYQEFIVFKYLEYYRIEF